MTVSTQDIYWLAGLLEGEGCFSVPSGSLRIALAMTDFDVVERASKLLGAEMQKPRKRPFPYKEVFCVQVFSKTAAAWMMTLFPLLGERRKQAIENSLSIWRKQRFKNPNGLGRKNPRSQKEREQNEAVALRYRNVA